MGPITGENTKGPDNLWALFLCGRGGTAYAPVFNTGALAGDCGCKSHRPHTPSSGDFFHIHDFEIVCDLACDGMHYRTYSLRRLL